MKKRNKIKVFRLCLLVFVFLACCVFAQDNLDHIIIKTAPGGAGEELGDLTMTADDSITLYAAGYDEVNNYIGDVDASWSSTGTLDPVNYTGISYTFSPTTGYASGTILARYYTFSDETGTINVVPGELAFLMIRIAPNGIGAVFGDFTMTVGDSVTLYADGYDAKNNYISDLNVTWSSTGTLDPVSYTGSSYTFSPITAYTSGTIIATYNGLSDTTGVINVLDSGLHCIVIRTAPLGAGNECGDISMTAGQSIVLFVAGYDAVDNYLGDISADWSSTGNLDPVSHTGSSFTFSPTTAPTSGVIIATYNNLSDATGTINVVPGVLHHIHINHGIYSDTTIYVGTALTFYAAGYDASDNYLGDVSIDWGDIDVEFTGTLQNSFPPIGTMVSGSNFTTSAADTGRGRIIFNKTDTTAFITVIENPLSLDNQQFLPTQFILETNAPNPFNNQTKISFQLPKTTQATLTIYDIAGRKVKELVNNRTFTPGRHSVVWDGTDTIGRVVGTGIYLYEIRSELGRAVRKMLLVK